MHNSTFFDQKVRPILKAATGIWESDEVTRVGLPKSRPTLVSGKARCVKTITPMLVRTLPPPLKKVIGNIASSERMLVSLELRLPASEEHFP